ncbi:hypothetical protein, partial [Pseudomonas sp. GP01-A3]|uniref:hypothetical protein n=1 Tax=Pseudomonas sp. GP01-A3 TaxID=2070568 RepID=UPI001C4422BD
PIAVDTPLGVATLTDMYEILGYWIAPPKSPDASGQFSLMPGYTGDANTGLRHRIPSFFLLANGGVLDKDIIQVNGMN